MFVQKEKLESSIGWSSNLSETDLQDQNIVDSKIIEFKTNHMYYINDPAYSQWKTIKTNLPQLPDFEINSNNEIIRTFYWNSRDEMLNAAAIMKTCAGQYSSAGNSIPYTKILIEEYSV